MLRRVFEIANSPGNAGNGYDLQLTLANGKTIVGPHSGIDSTGTWIEIEDRAQKDMETFVLISSIVAVAVDY